MSILQQPDVMDLELMTPGSVWVRKNGKESRYLFTTNTNLPVEHQRANPQMVVYADENDNIYSVPVAAFLEKRTFFNVDPTLESRLENLLAFSGTGSEGVDLDLLSDSDDTLTLDEGDDEITDVASAGDVATPVAVDPESLAPPVSPFFCAYDAGGTGLPEVITRQRLSEMTESYQQAPLLAEGKLLHTLFISAAPDITRDTLYACFSPMHIDHNAVYTYKVTTPEGEIDVDWDELVGIYPYVFQNQLMHQVVFSTNVERKYETVEIDVPVTTQPAEADIQFQAVAVEGQVVIQAAPVTELDNGFGEAESAPVTVQAAPVALVAATTVVVAQPVQPAAATIISAAPAVVVAG